MKIAFITETVPFRPRNGKELPTALQIEECARYFDTTLVVLVPPGDSEFDIRIADVPKNVKVIRLDVAAVSRWRQAVQELFLLSPSFARRGFQEDQVRALLASGSFDVVWLSPLGGYGLIQFCRSSGLALARFVALGLNDSLTHASIGGLRAVVKGHAKVRLRTILQALRLPFLWWFERRLVRGADLVHVQTPLEAARVEAIAGRGYRGTTVVAPNGRKELKATPDDATPSGDTILFMTHMAGPRAAESRWFLEEVWPIIKRRNGKARLLLGGTPPPAGVRELLDGNRITILGHVERLEDAYSAAKVAVVPIVHRSGCVNRVLDAFAAGVPLVTTSGPLSTISGAMDGVHALTGESAEEFAGAVLLLLEDEHRRKSIAARAKTLADQQPTWSASLAVVVKALTALGDQGASTDDTSGGRRAGRSGDE